jgi:hypothetical protein
MKNRITKKKVSFHSAFSLKSTEGEWPAGEYTIETEEEPLDIASFLAYRRIATTMIVRPKKGHPGATQFLDIDPKELEVALARDKAAFEREQRGGESST